MFLFTYLFIEVFVIMETSHHQLIHQNLKLNQNSTGRKTGSLCESFWSHGQSRQV